MASLHDRVKYVLSNITIEPLAFITMVIIFLSYPSTEELYLQKACQVNLNQTASLCANMTQPETAWLQQETQLYVASVQAHNKFLQKLPSVLFILFAGPLSDSFGRKPFLVLHLVGHLILNIVFLINVVWFHQLKVEYLLLECLQDLFGGRGIFILAAHCYIIDISSTEYSTARLSFLDALFGLAIMIAAPLGTMLRTSQGWITLYSLNVGLVLASLVYSYFLKDSIHYVTEEKRAALLEEKEAADIKCNSGVCCKVLKAAMKAFKAVLKTRPRRKHIWCFMAINILAGLGGEFGGVLFMFYQLQYKISTGTFGWMMSAWAMGSVFSQFFLVPFLSVKLGFRDTTIIILALVTNTASVFFETLMTQTWFLFLSWGVFQMLWGCMFTTALSALSKLVSAAEIGKFMTIVKLANTIVSLGAGPAFSFLYKATLSSYPAMAIHVGIAIFLGDLGLSIYTHMDLNKCEGKGARTDTHSDNQIVTTTTTQL